MDAGRIPANVLKDKDLLPKLPVFFRPLSGNKPSRAELDDLIKALRAR